MQNDIEEIMRAARSAGSLTRQLLTFSRKGLVQPAVLDVNEIVMRLDKMLRRILGEQVEFVLVEDDEGVRALGVRVLRQVAYTVLPARNAEEAIRLVERFDGKIDLLVTDIVMAGLDGRALARRLQQSRDYLRVLYTSGYADDSAANDVQAVSADFLQKPYTAESLARRVRGGS